MAFATFDLPEHERQRVCTFEDDPRGSMAAYAAGLYVCAITTRFSREHLQSLGIPPHAIADTYQEFFELFRLQ